MAAKPLPSPEVLRQLLRYEPETGNLFWKKRGPEWFKDERSMKLWNTQNVGRKALSSRKKGGHLHGSLLGSFVLSHRVAWTISSGAWPNGLIDHINGDPADNRLSNLREATHAQNLWNTGRRPYGTSEHKGVSWHPGAQKWTARIRKNYKRHHLGLFDTEKEASEAYLAAAKRLHGDFSGRV